MKVELCSFSGYKIYPGHGRRYARTDGKVKSRLGRGSVRPVGWLWEHPAGHVSGGKPE